LAYVGKRPDVWYVPMGPLYAFRTVRERTHVRPIDGGKALARFAISHDLDRKVYSGSVTLEFAAPPDVVASADSKPLPERSKQPTDRWTGEYFRREGDRLYVTVRPNTTLEFRRR
jgi:hypothetical protein